MRASGVATLALLCLSPLPATSTPQAFSPSQIEALLESGEIESAVAALDARLRAQPRDGQALLLRSTAHLMNGDLEAGRRDLQDSLAVEPQQRQGWLNLGALEFSQGKYREALHAFTRAEGIDPAAADNSLNIGAALLFSGDRDAASSRFRRYLEANARDAEAYFLVAVNYTMADRGDLAFPLLRRAVQLDERIRLRIRTDPTFALMAEDEEFRRFLDTDAYRPPADALRASRVYDFPFTGRASPVLEAALAALQLAGSPIETAVEVTETWALVWSDVRIKITAQEGGRSTVMVTSTDPRHALGWQERTEDLFRRISVQLYSQRPRDRQTATP